MGPKFAFHEYGCRIYCRLLENCSAQSSNRRMLRILEKFLKRIGDAINHVYGQFVVESILEHGQASHKAKIMQELSARPIAVVRQERGAFVLAKALQHGCAEDADRLSKQLLAQRPEHLAGMASSWSGRHVAKALMQQPWARQSLSESLKCPTA